VKTGRGQFIELQGTAEHKPFDDADLQELMAAADKGIKELIALQRKALGEVELKKEK
jgi:ribonuclease PH